MTSWTWLSRFVKTKILAQTYHPLNQICIRWLDSLASIIATNTFTEKSADIKEDLMDSSRQLLDHILEITPYERFIDMIKEQGGPEAVINKHLMDRAMSHFKGRQGMSGILIEALIHDMINAEKAIEASKSEATITRWMAYNPESQYIMLFRTCHHAVPVISGVKEGRQVYCHLCIKNNKNAAFQKVMDEVISGSEGVIKSDHFNSNVGAFYSRERDGWSSLTSSSPPSLSTLEPEN